MVKLPSFDVDQPKTNDDFGVDSIGAEDFIPAILKSGETDGFKWYIGACQFPIYDQCIHRLAKAPLKLAYVDVTSTKLDGIDDFEYINSLGVDLHCGCTFSGPGDNASLLRLVDNAENRWFVGEDYAHNIGLINPLENTSVQMIEEHLKNETIPSILKALVLLDLAMPEENDRKIHIKC